MASKANSPSPAASPTLSPSEEAAAAAAAATTVAMSPSPNKSPPSSPFEHSFYSRRRGGGGTMTVATTPPPTTTTTVPTPDPNAYEKSVYGSLRLTDDQLDLLKEQVRLLNGLPATRHKEMRRIKVLRPPKKWPVHTLTSMRRAELQQRRIVVQCGGGGGGGNMKEKYDEYERMMRSSDSALLYRQLRQDAMAHTNEDMDLAMEQRELQNLRYLALRAKQNEMLEYRDNQGSRLRFKSVRGQPIISSSFRDAYDDYGKPPFALPRRVCPPPAHIRPPIDKRNQIWLVPVEDEPGVPLHRQTKSPDPRDKQSRRERARPPLRAGKRTPLDEWKQNQGPKPKRPPWNFAASCRLNF